MPRRTVRIALSALALLLGVVPARTALSQSMPADSQDAFSGVHASLLAAADKTLASALAERPWVKMKTPEGSSRSTQAMQAEPTGRVERVRAAVGRVRQLRPVIEPILREEGIPPEMIAVSLVESGGLPMALSPKGARGVWQLMPDTARRYGLAVTPDRDDRTDVEKSTRAAARYLRDLYQQFGDWRLVFAAYNAGEQRVGRGVARGASTFEKIERMLPQETRDYVPAVLNAMAVLGGPTR